MAPMYLNPHRTRPSSDPAMIGLAHAAEALGFLASCPAHRPTPLIPLPRLAETLGLGAVHVKAEWGRMGLGSFKALGGAYAVARLVQARAETALGRPIPPEDLASSAVRDIAQNLTVICASAGNHGLAVAAGARAFGARAVVVLSHAVAERFAERLRARGATVERAGATYEESMTYAAAEARRRGWSLVSDSAWPGETAIPLDVMRGYTVLVDEAANVLDATGGPASHVFVQAGVGGLATAAAGYLRARWGEDFQFVVVEPEGAPCLLESVRQGRFTRIAGAPTRLGRLDCKEPSLTAFELLSRQADAFLLVSDDEADAAAVRLAAEAAPVSACGAAGAAGLIAAIRDPDARKRLGLDAQSRVLLIGTEAAEPSNPVQAGAMS
jgi:diaminopropionate ammonia-lyase